MKISGQVVHPAVLKIVIGCALVFGALVGYGTWKYLDSKAFRTEADVQAQLVGVWTHTQPTSANKEPYGWERWAFTSNTVQIQTARPSDTEWHPSSTFGYEITRRKTADTGQWYWHIHFKDSALNAALMGDGRALEIFRIGADSNYRLVKEDKGLSK